MKCTIDGQVVLLRAPEGPLAAYIKPFAGSLRKQGGMPWKRFTVRFCSPLVLADG
jgi:hypothetical protein